MSTTAPGMTSEPAREQRGKALAAISKFEAELRAFSPRLADACIPPLMETARGLFPVDEDDDPFAVNRRDAVDAQTLHDSPGADLDDAAPWGPPPFAPLTPAEARAGSAPSGVPGEGGCAPVCGDPVSTGSGTAATPGQADDVRAMYETARGLWMTNLIGAPSTPWEKLSEGERGGWAVVRQAVIDAATEGSLRACGYTLADVGRFLEAEAAAQERPAPGVLPKVHAHPDDEAERYLAETYEADDDPGGVRYGRHEVIDAYSAGFRRHRELAVAAIEREQPQAAPEPDRTDWVVFWGGESPDDCAGWDLRADEADAEEHREWITGGGVACRPVMYGPWTVTVPPPPADRGLSGDWSDEELAKFRRWRDQKRENGQ